MNIQRILRESRILVYCLVAAGVGAIAGSGMWAAHSPALAPVAAASATTLTPGSIETSFAPVVERALPAVVNISSSKLSKVSQEMPSEMDPFFRQFFGRNFQGQNSARQPKPQREHSLGSGVIVRSDGYLLTNNHVIDGATDITVTLDDKREFKAKVIGADPKTDIAVLKIDAGNLPTLPLADSTKARVGDLVLAMGSPFGLGQTVTMGIISAEGRNNLGIEDYEDFIQTDAPINPGNSGGALINTRGELVGINTAILANNGGNQGVGFAVPVNLARSVMTQVMDHGKVVRGYLGVLPQDITPAMEKALQLKQTNGVLIGDVTAGAPAAQAGLTRGDVILELDGQKLSDSNQLRMRVSLTPPGTTVHMVVLHNDVQKTVAVKLGEMPGTVARSSEKSGEDAVTSALEGVTVDAAKGKGVLVTGVDDGSQAAAAGLHEGDVILEVNRKEVASVSDFDRTVRNVSNGTALLLVKRAENTFYVAVQAS
jgi:serine protease Do